MTRRNIKNDYHAGHKAYMITLKVEGMVKMLAEFRSATSRGVEDYRLCLLPLGEAMRKAWLTLPERYPNIVIRDSVDEYVIMPEHFHGIVYVAGTMQEHLSEVIRLFKSRVTMSFRKLLITGEPSVKAVGTSNLWLEAYQALNHERKGEVKAWVDRQIEALYSATCRGMEDKPPFKVVGSGGHAKQGFLFSIGYTDSLLLKEDDLDGHRSYIANNPHSRWRRINNRMWLQADRRGIATGVTIKALEGYLRRECSFRDLTEEKLDAVKRMLLYSATSRGMEIVCQSYGNRDLLNRERYKLLPIVSHRKNAAITDIQMTRCLDEARAGAIMVSACISAKEKEIFNAVRDAGYPVVRVEDNGFPEIYHPSQERMELCAEGRLLIVTPWMFHYRHKDENIFVAYCKTMNCVVQALCH